MLNKKYLRMIEVGELFTDKLKNADEGRKSLITIRGGKKYSKNNILK